MSQRQRQRDTALEQRRREVYRRLEEIDAYNLWLTGQGVIHIAARAATTPHFVRRFLKERADDPSALPPRRPPRQEP
jgi:hypothetical protein